MKSSSDRKRQTKVTSIDTKRSNVHKSRKRANREYAQTTEIRNDLISKSILCPRCIKKFRVAADLEKHFHAKHPQSVYFSTINQASSTISQTALAQTKKKTEEYPTYLPHNLVSSLNPTENFGSTISRNIYSNVNHAQSTIFETITSSSPGFNCKMTGPFNQTKCTERKGEKARLLYSQVLRSYSQVLPSYGSLAFPPLTERMTHIVSMSSQSSQYSKLSGSTITHDNHLNIKHAESNLYTNTDRLNVIDNQPMMTKDQIKTTAHTKDHVEKICCWKCTRNFKTTSDRLKHFIHKHATSVRSKILELSTPVPSSVAVVENVLSNATTGNSTKKILSDENLIDHFVEKHAHSILSTDIDPSSILQDQIVMAQERSTTAQKMTIPTTVFLYNCSQCCENFTSADALANHSKAKHAASTVPLLLNHLNSHSMWIQKPKKATKQTINTVIPLSHRSQCLEIFENRVNHDSPSNVQHAESNSSTNVKLLRYAHDQSMIKNYQKKIKKSDSVRTFSCWICLKKSKSRYSRLDHFIRSHCASLLPTINMSSNRPYNQTTTIEEQTNSSNMSSNPLDKSNNRWECGKKFKSYNCHISHFIEKHTKQFLFTDIDPSNDLKNQITVAQEKMKAAKNTANLTEEFYNCFQCGEKFKSDNACTSHLKDEHAISTLCIISTPTNPIDNQTTTTQKLVNIMEDTTQSTDASFNSSEYSQKFIPTVDCLESSTLKHIECTATTNSMSSSNVDNHADMLQQRIGSTEPEIKFIQIPYYCERCKKDFLCAAEHLEHSKREHSEVNYSITSREDVFTDHGIIKCPRATFSTLVYMLLGTYRKQICITFGKTNRCPHDVCRSETIKYEFDELQSHITKEHHDTQLKLECCNPMVTYTLEEYKNHLVHDEKQEILWSST
jgi:hypothetical protein